MIRLTGAAKSAFLAMTAAVVLATAPAEAATRDFVGRWVNADSGTSGMTRLIITRQGGGNLQVRGFGQCHPRDCDWGSTRLNLFAPNARAPLHRSARRGLANFRAGFKRTTLTLTLVNANTMRFCTYNNFTDGSGRSDYFSCGTLKKRGRGRVRDHRRPGRHRR